jgi:hypothetical protein
MDKSLRGLLALMLLAPGQVLSDRPLRDLQVGDGGEDPLAYAMDMCRRQAQAPETCQMKSCGSHRRVRRS